MTAAVSPVLATRRATAFAAVAGPPLVLAAVGVTHPIHLTAASAAYWRDLHIWLLPVFPLLGLAPWLVLCAGAAPVALRRSAAVLGYAYAAGYTALDVLAGIGAGAVRARTEDQVPTDALFHYAGVLASVGTYALLVATLLAAATALVRAGVAALPGAVLVVVGGYSFMDSHIFWMRGVLTMLALAAGWSTLLWSTLLWSTQRSTGRPSADRAGR